MPRPVPHIAGWSVEDDDGMLIATRQDRLTDYQRAFGAIDEVAARDLDEFLLLVDAQTRLAEQLEAAEAAHPRIRAEARPRR